MSDRNRDSVTPASIRVIAIALFSHAGKILVFEGFDSVKQVPYYRPLGGGVEPGETTAQALRREIREELNQEIADLRLLQVTENLFIVDGRSGHEIVFIYDARFCDEKLYAQPTLTVHEDNGEVLTARWQPLDFFNKYHRLVPEELVELVASLL